MGYSFFWNVLGLTSSLGVQYRNRRDVQANSLRTCANHQPTLLFDRCWFCACEPCQTDLLFLVDQSASAETQCDNIVEQFDIADEVFTEEATDVIHTGAKEQIDFVIDAIENIPSNKMDSIRIAIALYGSQDQIEEIAGFGDTDIDEIKCKLYGYSGTEDCDMNIFIRKALCGQTGVYQAMKWAAGYDIFANFDDASFQWRQWVDGDTAQIPVTRMMVVTIADSFHSEGIDQRALMADIELLHDPHQRGFDTIYTIGLANSDREPDAEIQYWRNLNQIGCLNPEACDRTIMYDPQGEEDGAVDGAFFMVQLLSDESVIMNPFFCYYSRWNYFCEISPIIRVDRDAEEPIAHQEPYWGIVPDSCCGTRPYNSFVQECCDPSKGQVRLNDCPNL